MLAITNENPGSVFGSGIARASSWGMNSLKKEEGYAMRFFNSQDESRLCGQEREEGVSSHVEKVLGQTEDARGLIHSSRVDSDESL